MCCRRSGDIELTFDPQNLNLGILVSEWLSNNGERGGRGGGRRRVGGVGARRGGRR